MVNAGLGWLAAADATTLTTGEQAECLRGLGQAESVHTAARSKVMAAFDAGGGHEDDGHPTVRSWLVWRTRVTTGAAAGAVGWMRRLAAHPGVARALAQGVVSQSWAREICTWTDLLPEAVRGDADTILLAAAAAGADLEGLSDLAEQIRERTATPSPDDDGFTDRYLSLATTLGGAGVLRGDLTPQCAAAVQAVLESLGKRAGPEDRRTAAQRRHDALEEACRRLIAAGGLPERAGQPTQIMLHLTLGQLRRQPGADAAEAAWAGAQAGPGYDCDATIIPIVCGRIDADILDQLTHDLLTTLNHSQHTSRRQDSHGQDTSQRWLDAAAAGSGPGTPGRPGSCHPPASSTSGTGADPQRRQLPEQTVRQMLASRAADLLSGPGGLAAYLRNGVSDRLIATVSLPLDIGAAAEIIPAHLRRAVTTRDQHCRFPGCGQPVAACQPHHIIPRSQSGPTSLTSMMLLCTFHHLIAVHRWGWGIALHPDGTVTATSPDNTRILHSHGPPTQAA